MNWVDTDEEDIQIMTKVLKKELNHKNHDIILKIFLFILDLKFIGFSLRRWEEQEQDT